MKHVVILSLLLSVGSCKPVCPILNTELVNEFNSNLKIVENLQNHKTVKVDDYRKALLYLSATTGIMTSADYSSTLGYSNQKAYDRDMKLWKEWLENNKCKN